MVLVLTYTWTSRKSNFEMIELSSIDNQLHDLVSNITKEKTNGRDVYIILLSGFNSPGSWRGLTSNKEGDFQETLKVCTPLLHSNFPFQSNIWVAIVIEFSAVSVYENLLHHFARSCFNTRLLRIWRRQEWILPCNCVVV